MSKNPNVTTHNILSNPSSTFTEYENELESNMKIILKRFDYLEKAKVRELLEELDNNRELAIKILDEEEVNLSKRGEVLY